MKSFDLSKYILFDRLLLYLIVLNSDKTWQNRIKHKKHCVLQFISLPEQKPVKYKIGPNEKNDNNSCIFTAVKIDESILLRGHVCLFWMR